ncbi:MAG: family 16 glycoside hydrolase [Akkermansiaceae bacterium]
MIRPFVPFVVVCCCLLLVLPARADWQPLFNGENLNGWSGDPRLWRVENGVLIGETNGSDKKVDANSFLIWQGGEPGDFKLEFQARITGGNNSGVQYRSRTIDAGKWQVGGYQMDLHPNAPYLGMLYEERGRGIACERGQRVKLHEKPEINGKLEMSKVDLGQWNSYRIVAQGHVLRHFVNDTLAAEIEDVHPEKRAAKGVIALQLHAGAAMKAEFKEIRLQEVGNNGRGNQPVPEWIWKSKSPGATEKVFFRREFQLPSDLVGAAVTVTCDNWYRLIVNGKELGISGEWSAPGSYDVLAHLKPGGRNVIAVEGRNQGGSAGLALRFRATLKDGKNLHVVTDRNWVCSHEAAEGWENIDSAASGDWAKAVVLAKMGDGPWGDIMPSEASETNSSEDMTAKFQVADGFKLERLYRIPANQGSWVAITEDDKGRLLCADQYGEIYRVTLASGEAGQKIEPLVIPLKGAHGLLWHEGVLWVCINEGKDQSGVWRVTDSNGDGTPDKPELIKAFKGRGEHGPHGFALSPDGKFIYVVSGNHTDLPEMEKSQVARVWQEDQLLPRRPDARGHARDRMAPGGWVARFTPDGQNWELISIGYRNAYGLAFNEHGDLFTYDSDMEYDLGMPWYRPTRISHVVPGSEFGWRNGTGKWPEHYEDSMSSQLDIGPGSPTGVISGKGAKFPAKYQRAIYALDWTFATIYAIHLTPDGGGYRAEREEFVSGSGLPLTDAIVGREGAMYFLTGGRRTESALWRVSYTGSESTAAAETSPSPAGELASGVREDRRLLELAAAGEPTVAENLDAVWSRLGSGDRLQRYSARLVLEQLPPTAWGSRLAAEADPWRVIGGAIALVRSGDKDQSAAASAALDRLDWAKLDLTQKIGWLRATGLVFMRHGEPDAATRGQVLAKIDASFPATDETLNRELCRMLAYLQAPGVVSRSLTLMDSAGPSPTPDWLELAQRNARYGNAVIEMIKNLPPAQVIHYVYCLRVVKGPWHGDERQRFFTWIGKLRVSSGGMSYGGFLDDLAAQTLATATPEERESIAKFDIIAPPNPFANLPAVKGPGREWTTDAIVALAESGLDGRSKQRGHDIYRATLCAACHRFGPEGGAAGPDLTSLAGRFTIRDLAEAIIEPSKVVSDQYAFDLIVRNDGSEIVGKIIEEKDEKWIVATSPFDFSQTTEIERNEIKEIKRSPVSPMPPGLVNRLNPDELKDLLAYLLGKGE